MDADAVIQLTEAGQGDVGERRQLLGSFLKACLAQKEATVSANILHNVRERSHMHFADCPLPALALNNPSLPDTCLACADNNIYVMLAPGTDDVLIYTGVHAKDAEVVRGSFLIIPPRRHAFQCATDG